MGSYCSIDEFSGIVITRIFYRLNTWIFGKSQKLKQSKVKSFVKRKCDILFFKQADNNICFLYSRICGLAMIITALIFNIGQHFLTNKWALFAVTTVSWQVANSLDRK
ncbi:hypothetical protein ACO02O_06299 [Dirofilaria immitis]